MNGYLKFLNKDDEEDIRERKFGIFGKYDNLLLDFHVYFILDGPGKCFKNLQVDYNCYCGRDNINYQ